MSWFTSSNRYKHFLFAIPVGLVFTILAVIGVASGLELKDKLYGNKWDWLDWWMTIAGGSIGQIIQILIIYFIFR
jgi:hypothetical protein